MIFVLFFSLSYAKVQFKVILHNLSLNKTKKNCFTTQNLFFGRCVKRKEVSAKYNKWDTKYPKQKLATCLVKCKERELCSGAF